MKRTFLLVALAVLTLPLYSQKPFNPTPAGGIIDKSIQDADDTLYGNFFNGTPALYAAQSIIGGYASGNNGFGDRAKAQSFSLNNVCGVNGAIVWIGYKNYTSGDGNSKLNINLYDHKVTVAGQGATGLKLCPDSIFASKSIAIADLNASATFSAGLNVVTFDTPLYFDTLFAVGFDFASLAAGDTVACYTTTNGDADSTERAWEQETDSSWSTMLRNWNLDVDFAIFPIVNCTQTSIGEENSPMFSVFPNPAQNFVSIKWAGQAGQKHTVSLINSIGQVIYNQPSAGQTTILATGTLPKGMYYILVRSSDNKGYAQPIIVE